jgi:hypothetical protein
MSDLTKENNEQVADHLDDKDYHQNCLKDGYKGLLGAVVSTLVSELILWFGKVDGNPPLIFAAIGLIYASRHLVQIWQAKIQLKMLSYEE